MTTPDTRICEITTEFGVFKSLQDDLVTQQLVKYSAHSRNEISMLCHFLRPGDNILDIGAHIGSFAIPICLTLNKTVSIFSFEPQQQIFDLLKENVEANRLGGQISVFNGLVFSKSGNFRMERKAHNSMDCSFIPVDPNEHEDTIQSFHIDQMVGQQILPEKIDAIKIDVEGAEMDVLKACQQTIQRNLPVIYGEVNVKALHRFDTTPEAIEYWLEILGYHFYRNIGKRNSTNNQFHLARLKKLTHGGEFFDFIAFHQDSDRYPAEKRHAYFKADSLLTRHGLKLWTKRILGDRLVKSLKRL